GDLSLELRRPFALDRFESSVHRLVGLGGDLESRRGQRFLVLMRERGQMLVERAPQLLVQLVDRPLWLIRGHPTHYRGPDQPSQDYKLKCDSGLTKIAAGRTMKGPGRDGRVLRLTAGLCQRGRTSFDGGTVP